MSYFKRDMTAGNKEKSDGGPLDEFRGLCRGKADASVSVTMGYGLSYGAGKCSVTVTVKCEQNEKEIDNATRMATNKANQLALEGMEVVSACIEANNLFEANNL